MNSTVFPQVLTLKWLREKYLNNEISPRDVIEEVIDRASKDNKMNIWITPPELTWIEPYLTRLEKSSPEVLPLWGIPFAIKDNIDLKGIPTTAGCPDFQYIPKKNATVVERLIEAGAIPVGKANLDQFATGLVGTRSPYGETHNSLKPELISGGSSAGSAVAVARGQVAFSLGTDTAGSGRVPAALNNIIGFKPSIGAWSTLGVVPACESLDCVSVFAHTMEDTQLVDSVLRRFEENDPWSKPIPLLPPGNPEKIYIPKDGLSFFGSFSKEYELHWNNSLKKIRQLHIQIEYIDDSFFQEAASILYEGPWIAERWAALGTFVGNNEESIFPVTKEILKTGSSGSYDASSVFQAMYRLQELKRKAEVLLKNAVLLLPTAGGTWTREEVREDPIKTNQLMGKYTNHCNLLNLSALAVPGDSTMPDLPFGITFFTSSNQENLLFHLGKLIMKEQDSMQTNEKVVPISDPDYTHVAVCGLHMRGFPMEKQMQELGAEFMYETKTAPKYKFIKLPIVPTKPGLIKENEGGASIDIEIWKMPTRSFGTFVASIPAPLGIGKVEIQDGTEVSGFICESYAAIDGEDISSLGGWRKVGSISDGSRAYS